MNTTVFTLFSLGHVEGNGTLCVAPKPSINTDVSRRPGVGDVEEGTVDVATQNTTMKPGVFGLLARMVARGVIPFPFHGKHTMKAVVFVTFPGDHIQRKTTAWDHRIPRVLAPPKGCRRAAYGHPVAASNHHVVHRHL